MCDSGFFLSILSLSISRCFAISTWDTFRQFAWKDVGSSLPLCSKGTKVEFGSAGRYIITLSYWALCFVVFLLDPFPRRNEDLQRPDL